MGLIRDENQDIFEFNVEKFRTEFCDPEIVNFKKEEWNIYIEEINETIKFYQRQKKQQTEELLTISNHLTEIYNQLENCTDIKEAVGLAKEKCMLETEYIQKIREIEDTRIKENDLSNTRKKLEFDLTRLEGDDKE